MPRAEYQMAEEVARTMRQSLEADIHALGLGPERTQMLLGLVGAALEARAELEREAFFELCHAEGASSANLPPGSDALTYQRTCLYLAEVGAHLARRPEELERAGLAHLRRRLEK